MKFTVVILVFIIWVYAIINGFTGLAKSRDGLSVTSQEMDTVAYSLCSNGGAYHIPFSVVLPLALDIPGYHSIKDTAILINYLQNSFDVLSWKTFIALNWPAKPTGEPDTLACFTNYTGITVWENWMPSTKIFVAPGQQPALWEQGRYTLHNYLRSFQGLTAVVARDSNVTGNIHPLNSGNFSVFRIGKVDSMFSIFNAEQYPVIDSNHMYTLYENFYNKQAYDYIVKSKLYNKSGQTEFVKTWPSYTKGLTVTNGNDTMNIEKQYSRAYFPVGNSKDSSKMIVDTTYPSAPDSSKMVVDTTTYAFSKNEGAIIIKSAWIILTNMSEYKNYLTRTVIVKGKNGMNKIRTLGLVGMHIIHKVAEVTQWVWSSFEHINNAPYVDNTGRAILKPGIDYLYFDERNSDTSLYNKHPNSIYQPNPFSRKPSQVVNLLTPLTSTDSINNQFHALIAKADKNSVWLHYRLVGTQWPFNPELFSFGSDYKPSLLGNPIMETYVQKTSSCMSCHSAARFLQNNSKNHFSYGYNADFIWGLNDAR